MKFGRSMGQTLLKMMMSHLMADNLMTLAAKAEQSPNAQTQTM